MSNNHPNRNRERAIIRTIMGDTGYVTLPAPHWTGRQEVGTGIFLEALYYGPRTGRMFSRSYSYWLNNSGTIYRELDREDYLALCDKVGADPVAVEATEV